MPETWTAAQPFPGRLPWTPDDIKEKLLRSDVMVERSLLKLYARQTCVERESEQTFESNGIGFNGVDSKILTSFAKWVLRRSVAGASFPAAPEGQRLSPSQMAIARMKLLKYARQLADVANSPHKE